MFLVTKQSKCAVRCQEKYVPRFLVKSVSKFLDKSATKWSVRSVVISLVKCASRSPRLSVGMCQDLSALQSVPQLSSARCARPMRMAPPRLLFKKSMEHQ